MTPEECFRLFEIILENNKELYMHEAYEILENHCIEEGLLLSYSNFYAFKNSYYRRIHSMNKVAV